MATIMYLCDRKACRGGCDNSDCHFTTDIKHAVNFKKWGSGKNLCYIEDWNAWGEKVGNEYGGEEGQKRRQ